MKKFEIPFQYRSNFISRIKYIREQADKRKKDYSPTTLQFDNTSILLPRHFGFCFGVQNAVEKVYEIMDQHPDKKIYLLSEIIHNPQVNQELQELGLTFVQDTKGNQLVDWKEITSEDIVIIPAFGTTPQIESILKEKGVNIEAYDTTCPFVERVWNKGEKLAKEGYTIVIHGNFQHEETRATFNRIAQFGKAVVVSDLREADILKAFIQQGGLDERDWGVYFKWKATKGFSFRRDLERLAVVNQTTMLASETQEISSFLKKVIVEKTGEESSFGSTRDTLCYATNDNQTASEALMLSQPEIAFVIGGFNSSNTSHLVELLSSQCKTYFISSEADLISSREIRHFDLQQKKIIQSVNYLRAENDIKIAISSGASCPDAIVERVIQKILSYTEEIPDIEAAINKLEEAYNGL